MRGKTPPIHLTGMPMLEWGGVWDARCPKLQTRGGSSPHSSVCTVISGTRLDGMVCEIHTAPTRNGGGVPSQSSVSGPNWLDHIRMGRRGMHTAQNGANRFEVGQNGPSMRGFRPKW